MYTLDNNSPNSFAEGVLAVSLRASGGFAAHAGRCARAFLLEKPMKNQHFWPPCRPPCRPRVAFVSRPCRSCTWRVPGASLTPRGGASRSGQELPDCPKLLKMYLLVPGEYQNVAKCADCTVLYQKVPDCTRLVPIHTFYVLFVLFFYLGIFSYSTLYLTLDFCRKQKFITSKFKIFQIRLIFTQTHFLDQS